MHARISRPVALTASLALALAAGLAGCGQGNYTRSGSEKAAQRVAEIKSGTSWNTAQQQFLAGDLDKALKNVEQSIALNPNVAKSHILRARILIEKGDLDNARLSLAEAETIEPTSHEAQYYMGIIHERFGETQPALDRYTKAFTLEPGNAQYLIAASEMLIQLDKLDDAEALIEQNKAQFAYNAAVRQTQGHIAMLRGNAAGASKLFGEARLLAPDDITVLEDLVRAQIAAENFAEAEFNIVRLIEANKGEPRRDLRHMQARCLMRLDRPVEARSILLELTSGTQGESDIQAWIQLGDVAALLNDNARLKLASSRVVAMAPKSYEGHYLRGLYLRRQGDQRGALASLDKAISLCNTDPGPFVLRGLVCQDLGETTLAKESFEQAAQLAPQNKEIKTLLSAVDTE